MNRVPLTFLFAFCAATLAAAPAQAQQDEQQMGQQLFDQLRAKGEIVASSPLYRTLDPISSRITGVVQPEYGSPIHFYIVHEKQPNAFAAPGGNVYVTDSLFYFVKNREELAGTICHETSHLLHHDSATLMKRDEAIQAREIIAEILLGPNLRTILTVNAIGKLDSLHFSRAAEEQADLTGSDTCAAAGYNPWGLVWLFKDFSSADMPNPPELLSDHPDFTHRIDALEHHFAQDPARFARFDSSSTSATHIILPSSESETFLK
jgi:predicted Zn-dependent protease